MKIIWYEVVQDFRATKKLGEKKSKFDWKRHFCKSWKILMMTLKLPKGRVPFFQMLYGNLDKGSYSIYNDLLLINQTHRFMKMFHLDGCGRRVLLGNGVSQRPRKTSIPWLVPQRPMKWSGFILLTKTAERVSETRECSYTCGSCSTDGFGPDAGSNSREVDNEISTRGEPWDVGSSVSTRYITFCRLLQPIGINNFNSKHVEDPVGRCPGEIEALMSYARNI